MSGCGHGKTFQEPCTECQLVLAREGLSCALQSVEKYSKLIAELTPDRAAPWVELGTGWAKVHNLPLRSDALQALADIDRDLIDERENRSEHIHDGRGPVEN